MKDRRNFTGRPIETEPVNDEFVPESPARNRNRTGRISGCELLNVRRDPDPSAPIVTVLKSSDFITVQETDNAAFVKVTTPDGTAGYCMKKFIRLD